MAELDGIAELVDTTWKLFQAGLSPEEAAGVLTSRMVTAQNRAEAGRPSPAPVTEPASTRLVPARSESGLGAWVVAAERGRRLVHLGPDLTSEETVKVALHTSPPDPGPDQGALARGVVEWHGPPAGDFLREAAAAEPVDAPGEPPPGSVVTDTRSRVCWRNAEGWHRADVPHPITWADVVQAVGPDPQNPRQMRAAPGTPTVTFQPDRRPDVPMVTRPGGTLEVQMQVPMVGPDGEPMVGPDGKALVGANGRPLLTTVTETVEISEIVPASEARP